MKTNKNLGEFEMLVLAALIRLDDKAYGASISHEIETRTQRNVTIGALYTTLTRLEEKGYVRSRLGEATPERGGRAKRYYKITALGERRLKHSVSTLGNMLEGVAAWSTTKKA